MNTDLLDEELRRIDRTALLERARNATPDQVAAVLAKPTIEIDDLPILLSEASDQFLDLMASRSQAISLQRFGRTIQLYVPLYLSNYCSNDCSYCGYAATNKIQRRKISVDEAVAEATVLAEQGFRNLLLVSGEDRRYVTPAFLAEVGSALKKRFPALSMETQPLESVAEYRQCIDAGIDGLTLYQETYDREIYDRIHIKGRKKDFSNRLRCMDYGGEAGMRRLGIGILLGIADMIPDAYALATHGRYLQKKHWKSVLSFSFPRMQPMGTNFSIEHPVSDKELAKLICCFRLLFNDSPIILSTRESPQLRNTLLPCGVTQMSAGSSTEPGGYSEESRAEKSGTQFDIGDERSPAEMAQTITDAGYEPVWKDWQ